MVKLLFRSLVLTVSIMFICLYCTQIQHYNAHINKRVNRAPAKEGSLVGIVRVVDPIRRTSCSAFIVDDSFAILAGHCIKDAQKTVLEVFIANTHEYVPAKVVAFDTETDAGLIYGDFSEFKHLKVNYSGAYDLRHPLMACGYPRGQKELFCSNFIAQEKSLDLVKGHSEIYHGMSGGPVIDRTNNVVIGIIHAIDDDGYSYFVPTVGLFGTFGELE